MQSSQTKYDYEALINELLINNVNVDDAYIYKNHPLNFAFDSFFQFCQEGLSIISSPEGIDIEPSRFYFVDSPLVNATAFPRTNGYFRISVNRGTVEKIYDLFCQNNILDDPELIDYKNLSSFFWNSSYQSSLDYIIFQHSVLFVFFHELGHLIQFSNYESLNKGHQDLNIVQEMYAAGTDKFNILHHVMEFDADTKGAHYLGSSVLDVWSNLPTEQKTDDNLRKLIVLSLVGALSFFIMLLKFPDTGLYYYESTHPHPLMRLMWISKSLVDAIKAQQPDVDHQDIVNETLRVLNVYSRHKNLGNIHENYIDPYIEDRDKMSKYIYSLVETARTPGYEFLS